MIHPRAGQGEGVDVGVVVEVAAAVQVEGLYDQCYPLDVARYRDDEKIEGGQDDDRAQ